MTKVELIGGKTAMFAIGNAFCDYTSLYYEFLPKRPTTIARLKWICKKAERAGFSWVVRA